MEHARIIQNPGSAGGVKLHTHECAVDSIAVVLHEETLTS